MPSLFSGVHHDFMIHHGPRRSPRTARYHPPPMADTKLRTRLPNPRETPRFAGICTFGRYPSLASVSPDALPVDWAIFGVPFDGGTTYHPGARFGPRAIREASQYLKVYHVPFDVNIAEVFSLADAGDSPTSVFSCEQNASTAAAFAGAIGDPKHTRLLALGGDHSIALANMRATWKRRGAPKGGLALLHFDSHVDTLDQFLGERYSHASPFIRAIEEGLIDPKRMLSVGIKGPLNSKDDLKYARDHGVTLVTAEEWRTAPGQTRVAEFVRRLGGAEAYLSFDIDCIDPAYAPGTGTPCVGGFTSAEALALLRGLKGANIVGADVVEVLPARDVADTTAFLAAHIAFEVLALDASRRAGA